LDQHHALEKTETRKNLTKYIFPYVVFTLSICRQLNTLGETATN